MATITVTNLTTSDVYVADLYCTVPASSAVSTSRAIGDLSRMSGLQGLIQAGTVSLLVTPSAAEKAAGMASGDVSSTEISSTAVDQIVIRSVLAAGGGGSADDVTVYAVNTLPFAKMRVLDAYAYVSAGNAGGRTLQVRSAAAGAGTLCAEMPAVLTGRNAQSVTVTASQLLTNGASVGLFVRRSDSAIAGEVIVTLRPEV